MSSFLDQPWRRLGQGSALASLLALGGCGSTPPAPEPPSPAPQVVALRSEVPGPHFKVGQPYQINGRWYRPFFVTSYEASGVASWYGASYQGRPTANGEIYDVNALTAAHPTLQLPSVVRVTNLENGRSLLLRVNDRGPFVKNRLIDLSQAAARALGFEEEGLTRVHGKYLGMAPLDEPPLRSGEARAYTFVDCELPEPERLTC